VVIPPFAESTGPAKKEPIRPIPKITAAAADSEVAGEGFLIMTPSAGVDAAVLGKPWTRLLPLGLPLLLAALLLGSFLGDTGILIQDDEALHYRLALEMYQRHDPVLPTWFGDPAFYKPPFLFWLMMAGFMVAGPSTLGARLGVFVLALGSVAITAAWGRRLYGPAAGMLAGVMLATTLGFFKYGRMHMIEIPMLFLMLAATVCFYRAWAEGRAWWLTLSLGLVGASTLVKGPITALILLFFMLIWSLVSRRWPPLNWISVGGGVLLALVMAGIWPITLILRGLGQQWFEFFILRENLGKFSTLHYPASALIGGFLIHLLPWSVLFGAALWILLRSGKWKSPEFLFHLVWMVCLFLVFLLPAQKLKYYGLPALPYACLILGGILVRYPAARSLRWAGRATALFLLILVVPLLALLRLFTTPMVLAGLLVSLGGLLATVGYLMTGRHPLRWSLAFAALLLGMLPLVPATALELLPPRAREALGPGKAYVAQDTEFMWSLAAERDLVQIHNPQEYRDLIPPGGRCIITRRRLAEYQDTDPTPVHELACWSFWARSIPPEQIRSAIKGRNLLPLMEDQLVVEKDLRAP